MINTDQREFIHRRLIGGTGKYKDQEVATGEQVAGNRGTVGALSWLSTQTRPDLAGRTAFAQKRQCDPGPCDLAETDRAVKDAKASGDLGIRFPQIEFGDMVMWRCAICLLA